MNGQIQYGLFRSLTSGLTPALDPEESQTRFEVLELTGQIARLGLPLVTPPEPLPAGDTCHYLTPVRFGRRRSDQFGHLQLTNAWLKFRGALDVSVSWSEIARVERHGREITVTLVDSPRLFRFVCPSLADAGRGAVIAGYLTASAHAPDAGSVEELHATV